MPPSHPLDSEPPSRSLGGYRLVRLLGRGEHATVHLARDAAGGTVALRVARPGLQPETLHRGLRALALAQGAHVVRLLDLAAEPRGRPIAVLDRLAGPSLSALLVDRDRFEPGEAVTLLAPLAGTLDRVHAAGVAHGGLRAASVLLDGRGAPHLIGFGAAELLHPTPAAVETHPALIADRSGLRGIAAAVLERTGMRDVDAFLGAPDAGFAARLSERLFGWAPAEPVHTSGNPPRRALPTRVAPGWERVGTDAPEPESQAEHERVGRERKPRAYPTETARVGRAAASWLGAEGPIERLRTAVLEQARAVRRPVWLTAGAVAVMAALACALLPAFDGDDGDQASAATSHADDGPSAEPPAGEPGASATGAAPERPDPDLADPDETAVLGDDPVRAAPVLLRVRERCFREMSLACLDTVDQTDAELLADDQNAIRAATAGAELASPAPQSPGPVELTQRLGDTALVSVRTAGDPVPLLLVRTTEGWRLRSITPGSIGQGTSVPNPSSSAAPG